MRYLLFLLLAFSVRAASFEITLAAGDFDRTNAIIHFPAPPGTADFLIEGHGVRRAVQVDDAGQGWFIEPSLRRGETRTYTYPARVRLRESRIQPVRALATNGTVRLFDGTNHALSYQFAAGPLPRANLKPVYARGGYLHPVLSPSGRLVTDDYPANHRHHHGVWMAWTHTSFEGRKPDFWNMGGKKGTVLADTLHTNWSGAVHAGFRAVHRQVDLLAPEPRTVLNENWEARLFRSGDAPFRLFEITATQTCATASPLMLPKYHYGGLGLRGHGDWNGKTNCVFLTSEGITDREKGNSSRARWCYVGGQVDGAQAGTVILCHPGNFRAPQPLRLHPTEPFFCYAPQQLGEMAIRPGEPHVLRYRFAVLDGVPDAALIEQLWNDYAHPVQVTVRAK
jgi:hypothetical protein